MFVIAGFLADISHRFVTRLAWHQRVSLVFEIAGKLNCSLLVGQVWSPHPVIARAFGRRWNAPRFAHGHRPLSSIDPVHAFGKESPLESIGEAEFSPILQCAANGPFVQTQTGTIPVNLPRFNGDHPGCADVGSIKGRPMPGQSPRRAAFPRRQKELPDHRWKLKCRGFRLGYPQIEPACRSMPVRLHAGSGMK